MIARRQRLSGATIKDLVKSFLSSKEAMAWRPKTRHEFARTLRVEVNPVFGDRQPEDVKRGEVRALVDQLAERAPVMANRVFEVTRRLYTWAIGKDLVESSPCVGLSKRSLETQRDRVLTGDEIRAFWTACDAELGIIGEAFRLMLVTAQRRGEVLSMRWQDLDGTWWTIPAEFAKNGLSHRVPLSPQALAIIERLRARSGDRTWVFPSPSTKKPIENPQKAAERLRERSKVPGPSAARSAAYSGLPDDGDGYLAAHGQEDPEPRRTRRDGRLRLPFLRSGEAGRPRRVGAAVGGAPWREEAGGSRAARPA